MSAGRHTNGSSPSGAPCLWLTGLSGAGKSTVGELVARGLAERGHRVELLDGDEVRENLCADLGFSREDRATNVQRIAYVASMLTRNGVTVVVAAISPYRDARQRARAMIGERFVEVHVRATVGECGRRDVKGLYARAHEGTLANFTGVSDPYEDPPDPELVLDTERETPAESASRVLALVEGLAGAVTR